MGLLIGVGDVHCFGLFALLLWSGIGLLLLRCVVNDPWIGVLILVIIIGGNVVVQFH